VIVSLGKAGVHPFLLPRGTNFVWLNEDGVVRRMQPQHVLIRGYVWDTVYLVSGGRLIPACFLCLPDLDYAHQLSVRSLGLPCLRLGAV
jgi:hypothetical protein